MFFLWLFFGVVLQYFFLPPFGRQFGFQICVLLLFDVLSVGCGIAGMALSFSRVSIDEVKLISRLSSQTSMCVCVLRLEVGGL